MNNKNINKIKIKSNISKNIYSSNENVIELTLKDFDYNKKTKKLTLINKDFIKNNGFIVFYAPWCSHCKEFSDKYIELALSNENLFSFGAINIENIDDKNDHLVVYANVDEIPTLMITDKNGNIEKYKFKYNYDNLIFYINTNI